MLTDLSEAEKRLFRSKRKLPSYERLWELFYYDADNGLLVRKVSSGPRHIGKPYFAGEIIGVNQRHRKTVHVDGIRYHCHRLIWKMLKGADPEGDVDHMDLDKSNDRIENLRDGSRSRNNHNMPLRKDNTTGHKGILIHTYTKKYFPRIRVRGKTYYGTRTNSLEEAIAQRDQMRLKYLGADYVV